MFLDFASSISAFDFARSSQVAADNAYSHLYFNSELFDRIWIFIEIFRRYPIKWQFVEIFMENLTVRIWGIFHT